MAGVKGSKREPWEVVCPCGNTFMTACYTAKLCPDCQKERDKERKRKYRQTEKGKAVDRKASRKRHAKLREQELERFKKYHEEHREKRLIQKKAWYRKNAEKCKRYDKLRRLIDKGDGRAKLELAKLTGKALYCQRMCITAITLPCGKRDECWRGKPCPRTVELGLEKPKQRELYDFGNTYAY